MAFVVFVLVVLAVGWVVWRQRRRRDGPTPPTGLLASVVDQGRDVLAPLYPSRPLSRRALPRRLLRAAEQTITVGVSGMVLVPTRIEIAVNPADLEPFVDAMEWLRRDVAEALRQRAAVNGWIVPSGPEVTIVADEERPVRLPRAVGRIDAFRPEDMRTRRRTGPPPDAPAASDASDRTPTPQPDLTAATSVPTVPAEPTVHLRLVSLADHRTDADGDLNALLVAGAAPLVMGRSREAELRVKDRQASARHCSLSFDPDRRAVVVRDLGSTNGTHVDDRRVDEAPLAPGATLRLGQTSWRADLSPL